MDSVDVFENLSTGITPDGESRPDDHSAEDENVDTFNCNRGLWSGIP